MPFEGFFVHGVGRGGEGVEGALVARGASDALRRATTARGVGEPGVGVRRVGGEGVLDAQAVLPAIGRSRRGGRSGRPPAGAAPLGERGPGGRSDVVRVVGIEQAPTDARGL